MGLMFQMLTLIEKNFSIPQQKIILPTVMAGLLACSTAYGMWQGMWLGNLFYVSAMCLMTCKLINNKDNINMKI
jgi:hypothetical protein